MKLSIKLAGILTGALALGACATGPEEFIVDGPKGPAFQADLASCEQLSLQKEKDNSGKVGGAVVGGLIGAADADSGEALEGALIGGVLGGLFGSAEDTAELDEARHEIVHNCLKGRGHNVVG